MIDLRSDTVTVPTEEMRKFMMLSDVGDDVYGEDKASKQLESMSAEMFGKESALFIPTGTMGNQLAVMTHCQRGQELCCDDDAHVYYLERGGAAVMAGVQIRTMVASKGIVTPEILEEYWRGEDIHYPVAKLVWVENTHNRSGGTVYPLEVLKKIQKWSNDKKMVTHMDGARIFNASIASNIPVNEIASTVDTVMFCISKGLGAPVGSLLLGEKEYIAEARRWRKMMGGGMRQVGFLASAGIYALNNHIQRLSEDHDFAKEIAKELSLLGYILPSGNPETNIVMVEVPASYETAKLFTAKLKEKGLLVNSFGARVIRIVTHQNVNSDRIGEITKIFKEVQEG